MIPEYADDLNFENRLPPGQAPIMTNSVKRFHAYMQFIMQSREETGYATMGVITGDAGVWKTIAIQPYLQQLQPRAYSGFPACVGIKVRPRSTAKALAKTLVATLNGEQAGHNVYDLEAVSAEAIRRNDLDPILVDEGDWFVPGLREVLPVYETSIGSDGTLEWQGWHYREMEHDLLRYWPDETVTIRPSPSSEALIWIYWKQEMLCEAVAEELCHKDRTYHPYWFPYPRLGE